MKRIVSLLLVAAMALRLFSVTALADDTPVLRLATSLHTEQTAALEDLFIIKHLEKKFNVKFELESIDQAAIAERQSQMFLADDLPDLVWLSMNTSDIVTYGMQEGMLFDWTPYLNEESMPNLMKALEDYPEALVGSTAPDGKVYSLPYIRGAIYANNTGAFSATIRMNINTQWLEAVGKDMPATLDEFIDVARAFKEQDPAGVGEQLIPIIDNQNKVKDYIWNALGFYAGGGQTYGTEFAIKNDKLVLPAYTAEAKAFMQTVKTLYDEGLVSPDYFTLDQTTNRGLVTEGVCGIFGDSTLQPAENNWEDWTAMSPLSSDVNDTRVASYNLGYSIGSYASSSTKYPELVVAISDYLYSLEGAMYYQFGPMKGSEDDIDGSGWYILEDNTIINDLVASNPTYTLTNGHAAWYYIGGRFDHFRDYPYVIAGVDVELPTKTMTDVITGKEIEMAVEDPTIFADDNWDRHWRVTQTAAMEGYLTAVRLPSAYLMPEQQERVADLKTVIDNYVTQETPKFITGARSLDEFDAYQEELKNLGIEEYISIYEEAYANFLTSTYGE